MKSLSIFGTSSDAGKSTLSFAITYLLLGLVTCGYVNDEDLHKRPLSKLIKDISKELKLI